MKKLVCLFAGLLLIFGVYSTVYADVINFGVDIYDTNGGSSGGFAYAQVPGGFTGDDTGYVIDEDYDDDIYFYINTGLLPAGSSISGAKLFIDATDVSSNEDIIAYGDPGSDWYYFGYLQSNSGASTFIPVLGVFGATVVTPYSGDVDNTFFNMPSSLNNEILSGSIQFAIFATGNHDDARIDGLNLQVQYTPPTSQVPEPGTMFLLGLGLLGVAAIRRLKK